MPDCERWIAKLHTLYRQFQPLCEDDLRLTIDPPATYLDVERVEIEIGRSLPAELKEIFTHCSAKIDFWWSLWSPGRVGKPNPLPKELHEVTEGHLNLDLKAIADNWCNWTEWQDYFENPEYYEGAASSFEFDDLLPLFYTFNGDVIVLVTEGETAGQVLYLSHEGGLFDEAILADSLSQFMDVWLDLGCPGPECSLLEPFYDWPTERLLTSSPNALQWKSIIDGSVPLRNKGDRRIYWE
jgi:cell wall assembly regulator SMI1